MIDISKTTRMNELLDIYGPLLTDKQMKVMSSYFCYDLSLSEIADNEEITRAAVHDLISRVCTTLEEYEAKLHLLEKKGKIDKIVSSLPKEIQEKFEKIL